MGELNNNLWGKYYEKQEKVRSRKSKEKIFLGQVWSDEYNFCLYSISQNSIHNPSWISECKVPGKVAPSQQQVLALEGSTDLL